MGITGLAIPYSPLRSLSEGCQLESVRVTPNGEMFLLRGSGFPPNTDLTLMGDSAGELHPSKSHTDAEGRFQKVELPFVIGKDSGTIVDKVTEGATSPSITAKWSGLGYPIAAVSLSF